MKRFLTSIFICFTLGACSSAHRVNGWYPVADFPENKIEGEAFVTTKDFAEVSLDTVSVPDMAVIEGRLKAVVLQSIART